MILSSARLQSCVLFLLTISLRVAPVWAADVKPEWVVARHLESVGSARARNAIRSRVVQGGSTYRIIVGGSGAIDGKFVFGSEGPLTNFLFKINASSYHGEQFICDGKKTSVAGTWSDKTRSEFGDFVLAQDILLKDNLLGGVWSSGWPFFDLDSHKAKLHVEGIKKVDGRELLAVRYQPKKSTDLSITMFFDPETYRHIKTLYTVEPGRSIEGGEMGQAQQAHKRYRLEETFSEFQTVDELTLPSHYDLRYTLETESGATKAIQWEVRAVKISNNISIDARSFEVR